MVMTANNSVCKLVKRLINLYLYRQNDISKNILSKGGNAKLWKELNVALYLYCLIISEHKGDKLKI